VPYSYVSATTITVESKAVLEFESYVKKINAGAVKIGVPPATIYSVRSGGPGFTYVATVRYSKWADLDDRPSVNEILNKAYGEVEGAKIGSAGRASIETTSNVVLRVLQDLSSPPASMASPFPHVRLVRTTVKPGMGSTWEAYLGKIKAAQDKNGGNLPVVRSTNALGPSGVYTSASFFSKFAQLDTPPEPGGAIRKAFGDGEAKLLEDVPQNCIASSETLMLDSRPDLMGAATAAAPAKK
jgi:hypothetical protein